MTAPKLPERLQNHRGFARTFQPGKLTLGLISFKGYPDSPVPEMDDFATVIKPPTKAVPFTLWVRYAVLMTRVAVIAQIYDPSVTLLSRRASPKTLRSARRVMFALRELPSPPKKPHRRNKSAAAASCSVWPAVTVTEYPAFAADFNTASDRYREVWVNHPPPDAGKIPRVQRWTLALADPAAIWLVAQPAHGLLDARYCPAR